MISNALSLLADERVLWVCHSERDGLSLTVAGSQVKQGTVRLRKTFDGKDKSQQVRKTC